MDYNDGEAEESILQRMHNIILHTIANGPWYATKLEYPQIFGKEHRDGRNQKYHRKTPK